MKILMHDKLQANAALFVNIYDADNNVPIDISSVTNITAKAIHSESGTEVSFVNATVSDGPNGTFKLSRSTNTFTEAGVYDIEIQFTDTNGEVQIHPRYPHLKLSLT